MLRTTTQACYVLFCSCTCSLHRADIKLVLMLICTTFWEFVDLLCIFILCASTQLWLPTSIYQGVIVNTLPSWNGLVYCHTWSFVQLDGPNNYTLRYIYMPSHCYTVSTNQLCSTLDWTTNSQSEVDWLTCAHNLEIQIYENVLVCWHVDIFFDSICFSWIYSPCSEKQRIFSKEYSHSWSWHASGKYFPSFI